MIKVMLSAGEISGDMHGAALAKELKNLNRNIFLFGMGGERMRSAGVELIYDLSSKGTVGIIEILKFLPSIIFGLSKMKRVLKKERPDILVLIDYQGFNMLLAKYAKKLGIKTVYYIAPQEWLWGTPKGIKNVVNTLDKILCIFEDEARIYKSYGGNTVHVGNPNVDAAKAPVSKEDFCRSAGLNPKFPIFGIFPGSRHQEIDILMPIMMRAAKIIKQQIPNSQFVLGLSSIHFKNKVEALLRSEGSQIPVMYGKSHAILNAANVSIAASGTITMEAAILDAPIIMAYKLSALSHFIAKYIVKLRLRYYTMPNILTNKEIIPEFLQEKVSAENIAAKALALFTDKKELDAIKSGYREARAKLGPSGAVKRAASEIFEELRGKV